LNSLHFRLQQNMRKTVCTSYR